MHLIVSAGTVVKPSAADGVDFVKEDETGLLGTRHLKQLPHHPRALAHVLLNELRAYDADEASVGAVGHCSGAEGLACKFNQLMMVFLTDILLIHYQYYLVTYVGQKSLGHLAKNKV